MEIFVELWQSQPFFVHINWKLFTNKLQRERAPKKKSIEIMEHLMIYYQRSFERISNYLEMKLKFFGCEIEMLSYLLVFRCCCLVGMSSSFGAFQCSLRNPVGYETIKFCLFTKISYFNQITNAKLQYTNIIKRIKLGYFLSIFQKS